MERSKFRKRPPAGSLIIGRQPLVEALQAGRPIDKILFQQNISGQSIGRIRELARQMRIPIQQVPASKLNGLSSSNHQGVIAFAAVVPYYDLQEVIDHTVGSGATPLMLMLDGITDIRNIGAIARSAVCYAAQSIIIPDKGVGALNEETLKASAGALEKIAVCRVNSLMKAVDALHLNGIRAIATGMKAEKTLMEIDFKEPCCIIMGSEDKGIYPALEKVCDETARIPMAEGFESLNVSVAAGIVLYEAWRQRMGKAQL